MKKKIIISILIILIVVVIGVSTLALFTWTSPNTTLTLEVGELTDVIFQEGNDINATNMGPVLNYEDGEMTEFTIINKSDEEQLAKIYLDISEISDTLKVDSFKYILQTSSNGNDYNTYKEGTFVNATTGEFNILEDYALPSGTTYYRFIIYIDGNMENSTTMMNNSLKAILNVTIPPVIRTSDEMLNYLGLTSNGVKDTVNAVATTDEGVWETQDDYGTTYYFRGAVENNYVKFAGFYWRIVRINGDGTLRLIYDGTSAHANGESSTDRQIGTSAYNENYDDNAYVGYMYGQTGASSYSATHANTNDSTIKTVVDNWYQTNIADTGYGDKVTDIIYCNDRQIAADSASYGSIYYMLGYGNNNTIFAPASRLMNTSFSFENNQEIKMTCSQKNDAFTVDDIDKGNGALTYPVGIITVDEVLASGGFGGQNNDKYYLYTGNIFWTTSPYRFVNNNVIGFAGIFGTMLNVNSTGSINNIYVYSIAGVRPVISLKSSVELTGNGTIDQPYEVVS